jgi:transposase-like protein/IS1 family transposase
MLCPICQVETRRFGRDRNGYQRFQCLNCRKTFTEPHAGPIGAMRLDMEKAILALRLLLEGNSVRSIERLIGVGKKTILRLMVLAGERCERFMESFAHRLDVNDVQVDEIWAFVRCKEKTKRRKGYGEECGDAYCFTALERNTKMIIAWHVGKRSPEDTLEFADKLRSATRGRFQLTTDGFTPYRVQIPYVFGPRVDFAQLVKVYGSPAEPDSRYSPGEIVDTKTNVITGDPDPDSICTSHVERHNRTLRMQIRRLTRLTDAHSKKWENHEAALGLFFAYYNLCRVHITLNEAARDEGSPVRKVTPAMAAGLTDHVWSVKELLERAAG